jgi:hypothetical protein
MSFSVGDSQQFKIEDLSVVTKTGEAIDISNIYEEINIFDSLLTPVITGKILVRDSIGLSGKLFFDGSESILITITKSEESSIAEYKKAFRIYKQTGRQDEGLSSEYYFLNFCSDELIYSDQQRVNQAYDSLYSAMINSILTDYLMVPENQLGGSYENSTGIRKVIIPNLRPFEAIEWCTKRAVDEQLSPNFVFWQNVTGYNFSSLSSLLVKDPILDITFEMKNTTKSTGINELSGARSIEVVAQTDAMSETRSGVNAGKFIGFDPITRVYEEKNISYNDHYSGMKHANKNPNVSVIPNRENKNNIEMFDAKKTLSLFGPARKLSKYIKQNDPESLNKLENYEDVVFQRKAIINNLMGRRLRIVMPGNFQLSSGFNVFVEAPALAEKEKGSDNVDKSMSGKYIIIGTRHIIGYEKHETVIEVATSSSANEFVPAASYEQTKEIMDY